MRILIISAITLLLGVWLAQVLREDTGYVLVGMGQWTVEMSFVLFSILAVLSIFAGHYLIRTFSGITHSPKHIKNWRHKTQEKKATKSLSKGLLAQGEGQWHKAERALVSKAEKSQDPIINYLEAAKAATAQGATERADRYLRIAQSAAPKKDISVDLTRIELMLGNKDTDKALTALTELRSRQPKNTRILSLLAETYKQQRNWGKLAQLLPEIEKRHALELDTYLQLEQLTFEELFNAAIDAAKKSKDSKDINQVWALLPKKLQNNNQFIFQYCNALIQLGESSVTETMLRQAIEKEWQPKLVLLYGLLKDVNYSKQLEQAERWLNAHKDDEVLLLTLGRLSAKKQLWGKARSYLETSINLKPKPETYYALATLLEGINEKEKASEYYRQGLTLAAESQQYAAA